MKKALKLILETLSREQMIQVIEEAYSNSGKDNKSVLEQAISAYKPKELYKFVSKAISSINKGTRFINYRESHDFASKLEHVNKGIEQLLPLAPDLALKLCQRFIAIDGSICQRMDDSAGYLTDVYYASYRLLDQAFVAANTNAQVIAKYLYDTYSQDEYGLRGYILECSTQSLKAGADHVLETLLQKHPLNDYATLAARKVIADSRKDVDAYIQLLRLDANRGNRSLSDESICDIACRLNAGFRGQEAIEWLNKIDDDSHHYSKKIELLMEACRLEGKDTHARALLWQRFERTLNCMDYDAYLKHTPERERETIKRKAIALAKAHQAPGQTLRFLQDIQLWEEIERMILDQARADTLNTADYSFYRKLSTALDGQSKSLSAALIRRELVLDVLHQGLSKYYQYAVSDLKKAHDFAQHVSDWQNFTTHEAFMLSLETQHIRKSAFWAKVENAKLQRHTVAPPS